MTAAEKSGECRVACICCCINDGRFAMDWFSCAMISLRLTCWDVFGAGLRQREIAAT